LIYSSAAALGSGIATAPIIPAANNAETKTLFTDMFHSPKNVSIWSQWHGGLILDCPAPLPVRSQLPERCLQYCAVEIFISVRQRTLRSLYLTARPSL
jgi:hypothetical protein